MAVENQRDYVFRIKADLDDSLKTALNGVSTFQNQMKGMLDQINGALNAAISSGIDVTKFEGDTQKIKAAINGVKQAMKAGVGDAGAQSMQGWNDNLQHQIQLMETLPQKIALVTERLAALKAAGQSGGSEFIVNQAELRRLEDMKLKLEAAGRGATNTFGAARGAIQNASYQVTDFIVQVQGGTSAMRALGQQLPQLLGGFGAWGAAAGLAATAVTTIISVMQAASGTAKQHEKDLQDVAAMMKGLTAAAETVSLEHVREQLRGVSAEARYAGEATMSLVRVTSQLNLAKTADDQAKAIKNIVELGAQNALRIKGETVQYYQLQSAIAAVNNGMEGAAQDFISEYGPRLSKFSSGMQKAVLELAQASAKHSEAMKNLVADGENYTRAELAVTATAARAAVEGDLVKKVRERGEAQRELNTQLAAGGRIEYIESLRDTIKALDLEIAKIGESTKASDADAASKRKAARDALAEQRRLEAEQKVLQGKFDTMVGAGSAIEAARAKLVEIVRLRGEMVKAGMASANAPIFEERIAAARDKINQASSDQYLQSLSGVQRAAAEASITLDAMANKAKIGQDEMNARMEVARQYAVGQTDQVAALAEAMKALNVPDSYLTAMDRVNVLLHDMGKSSGDSVEQMRVLNEKFGDGTISAEQYADAVEKIKNSTNETSVIMEATWSTSLERMKEANAAAAELPPRFEAWAEAAHLSSSEIDMMTKKFPQLESESRKALTKLKDGLENIAIDKLSDALSGNVKDWRKWGSEVLKQLSEVLMKWALMRAATSMFGGSFGGGAVAAGASVAAAPPVGNFFAPPAAPPPDGLSMFDAAPPVDSALTRAVSASSSYSSGGSARLGTSGGTKVEVHNYGSSQVETQSDVDENGVERIRLMIRDQVRSDFSSGAYDTAMRGNYGISRRPI